MILFQDCILSAAVKSYEKKSGVILVLKCTEDSESSVCVALLHVVPPDPREGQSHPASSSALRCDYCDMEIWLQVCPWARQTCLVFLSRCVHTCSDLKVFHGFKMLKQKPFHFQAMAC